MPVSRRVRAAWIIGGSLFTIGTLTFGTVQAVAGLAHEERDVHTVIDGPFRLIDIEAAGSVRVVGTDSESVTIDEHVSEGLQDPDRSIRPRGDELEVRGTCRAFPETFCSDDFVLRVPRGVALRVRSNGVSVSGVRGPLELESDGGDIRVRGAVGELWLRSHGGSIDGRALGGLSVDAQSDGGNTALSFRAPPARVDASSHGGDIFIGLPQGSVAYRIDASAHGGSADTPVRTDPTSNRTIHAESYGGDITIRYANG